MRTLNAGALAQLPNMELSKSPLNKKFEKERRSKPDFREKITYRQNIDFKISDFDQTSDINEQNFWEKFLNQDHGQVLIVSDNQYEIEISRANFGDKILKYFDKTRDMVFMPKLDDLSKDFAKQIIITFCENENEWKSKLEWEHIDPNSLEFSIKKFGYYASLILVGLFFYFKINDDLYSEKIVDFLQARNISVMLAMASLMGVLLIFDRYEIRNFEKIGNQSKFWIGMEAFALVMFILFYFWLP